MADASDDSTCKQVQEGKKPLRSCYLCRREDCEVWQEMKDLAEESSISAPRPPYNGPNISIEEVRADAEVKNSVSEK